MPAGTLHLAPGFAPIAAGRVTTLDLEPVRAAPGVVAVLTADDIPGRNDISPKEIGDDPVIAESQIMFYGQVLFVVVAETRATGPPGGAAGAHRDGAHHAGDRRRRRHRRRHHGARRLRLRARRTGRRAGTLAQAGDRRVPHRRAGALLPRRPGGLRHSRRGRRHGRPCLDPASERGAARRRPRPRPPRQRRHRRGAAHGRRLRRQGEPGHPMGGAGGAGGVEDRASRARCGSTATTT